MELTLGDLLDHPELGLRLLTGGDAARHRPVRGAHPIEVVAPTRWVPRNWVLLTNGLRLRGRPHEQRQLVADLDEEGQAAIGWAVGIVMQRVPPALLEEARRRDFPVFLVPYETAFHQIVSFLTQARTHDDVYVMQRVQAMEDYLMDALRAAQPEQAAVRRLASLLNAEVLLAHATGEPLESSGATPSKQLQQAIADHDTATIGALLGGTDSAALLTPVHPRGVAGRVLVAALADEAQAPLARPLLLRAAQLLELLGAREANQAQATRQQMSDLLHRLLTTPPGRDTSAYDAEAAKLGMQVDKGAHAVGWRSQRSATLTDRAGRAHGTDRVPWEPVQHFLAASGFCYLLAERAGVPVGVVQAGEAELAEAFARFHDPTDLVLGIGGPMASFSEFATSLAGAQLALSCQDGTGQVVRYGALDPVTRMLATAEVEGTLDGVRSLLEPLRSKPHLRAALACWLAVHGDMSAAAERLHLHRNSLRYRLSRVEHLTGMSLTTPKQAANLEFALLADELHERMSALRRGGRAD